MKAVAVGCLEIAQRVGRGRDFNYSDEDPEHDKQGGEKQQSSDDFLHSALPPSGRPVSPGHGAYLDQGYYSRERDGKMNRVGFGSVACLPKLRSTS